DGSVIGTNRELLAASLAARAAAWSRSMKTSASMACLPGLPLPFVGGVALAVQIVGVSERYGPSCGTEQTLMAHGLTTAGGAVRRTKRYGMSGHPILESLRLDARELDHLAPLFGIVRNKFAELGRRAWKHRGT